MRGYQRKIIYLKNTGSPYFEQAYFVVRDGVDECGTAPPLSEEADRILGECARQNEKGLFARELFFFLFGAALALGVSAVLLILL